MAQTKMFNVRMLPEELELLAQLRAVLGESDDSAMARRVFYERAEAEGLTVPPLAHRRAAGRRPGCASVADASAEVPA